MSTKVTELPAITSLDTADVLPIVDVSAAVTKKVTVAQLTAMVGPPFSPATISMTSAGTDVTASSAEAASLVLHLTGSYASNQNLLLPNTAGSMYVVYNATSGQRTLMVSGGTGVAIASGASKLIFHDGTDYRTLS